MYPALTGPQQTVWVQDIPAVSGSAASASNASSADPPDPRGPSFPACLSQILNGLSVPLALQSLKFSGYTLPLSSVAQLATGWDFSRVTIKLVASIAGKYEGWSEVLKWGHTRLMFAVREMGGTRNKEDVSLECQVLHLATSYNHFYI